MIKDTLSMCMLCIVEGLCKVRKIKLMAKSEGNYGCLYSQEIWVSLEWLGFKKG